MAFKINSKTVKALAKTEQKEDNLMYFDSDEEFTNFCVAPFAVIKRSEDGAPYYDGEYSDEYKKCLEEGKVFVIKDEDSIVYKRQCVTKRVPVICDGVRMRRDAPIQLEVQGLQQYFGDKFEMLKKNHVTAGSGNFVTLNRTHI